MANQNTQPLKFNPRMVLGILLFFLFTPTVLFIASGQLNWKMAWVYSLLSVFLMLGSRILMTRKHPDLVAERFRFIDSEGTKEWDKKLVPWIAQIGPLIVLLFAGLDKRFGWSPSIPSWVSFAALFIALLGYIFSIWALIENRFFSSVVRIQTERGHTVCDTGPYKIVRHPGYAGGLIWNLMTPLILSSLWAYLPTLIVVTLLVVRTSLEDKTLQAELPGYQEYTRITRFRLIPGVW